MAEPGFEPGLSAVQPSTVTIWLRRRTLSLMYVCVCVVRNFARKATKFVWSRRWRGLSLTATWVVFIIVIASCTFSVSPSRVLLTFVVRCPADLWLRPIRYLVTACRQPYGTAVTWPRPTGLWVWSCLFVCLCERGDWERNFGRILTKSSEIDWHGKTK